MNSHASSDQRIAGIAGIAFVISFVVVIALSLDSPGFDDPAELRDFFVNNATRVHLVTWLGALAIVFFFLPFATGLRNLLAPVDTADEPLWTRLSFTGAVVVAATLLIGTAFWEVLSFGAAETLSDETLVAIARFDSVTFSALMPWALALFIAAASIVMLRSRIFASWIGWFGVIAAAISLIGTLWIFTEDEESVLAFISAIGIAISVLWVLLVSIAMTRATEQVAVPGSHGRVAAPSG